MRTRRLSFLLLTLAILGLAGCSPAPSATAEKFTVALAKGDVTTAKKYCTPSTAQMLDFAASMGAAPAQPNFKFVMTKQEIDGNRATVRFKDEKGKEQKMDLVKIDGRWQVEIRK